MCFASIPTTSTCTPCWNEFADLNPHRLRELSFGTFFYAALLLTEGVGLAIGQTVGGIFHDHRDFVVHSIGDLPDFSPCQHHENCAAAD